MANENDQPEISADQYLGLKPAGLLTRKEFIEKARGLIDEMEHDHEEQTGMSETETQDFSDWCDDLISAYLNS